MKQIQFIGIDPKELKGELVKELSNSLIPELSKLFQPKEPSKYVTRNFVADEMLHCDLSTVHNLTVKGILLKYQIGGRVLYIRQEVENAIVQIKY